MAQRHFPTTSTLYSPHFSQQQPRTLLVENTEFHYLLPIALSTATCLNSSYWGVGRSAMLQSLHFILKGRGTLASPSFCAFLLFYRQAGWLQTFWTSRQSWEWRLCIAEQETEVTVSREHILGLHHLLPDSEKKELPTCWSHYLARGWGEGLSATDSWINVQLMGIVFLQFGGKMLEAWILLQMNLCF